MKFITLKDVCEETGFCKQTVINVMKRDSGRRSTRSAIREGYRRLLEREIEKIKLYGEMTDNLSSNDE